MKYREKKSTVKSKFRQHVALQLVGNITFQHFWPVRGSQAMFVVSTGQEQVTNL